MSRGLALALQLEHYLFSLGVNPTCSSALLSRYGIEVELSTTIWPSLICSSTDLLFYGLALLRTCSSTDLLFYGLALLITLRGPRLDILLHRPKFVLHRGLLLGHEKVRRDPEPRQQPCGSIGDPNPLLVVRAAGTLRTINSAIVRTRYRCPEMPSGRAAHSGFLA